MTDNNNDSSHTSYYVLNREYFSECFDESANTSGSLKTYLQAIFFIIVAAVLFTLDIEAYAAWFLVGLGVIELLSIRYKRSWWITRQMFSKSADSKVNVRIDEQGISTESVHFKQDIVWGDISEIKSTERGFVVSHNNGSSYLSKNGLNDGMISRLEAFVKPST